MYYLENTLKLAYQSNSGLITLEKLSLNSITETIAQIESLPLNSPMAVARTAGQKSAFNISICGVTWQKNEHTQRIKAIAGAALLRSQTAYFSQSQAVFKHASLLEHEDILTSQFAHSQNGMYDYNGISISQFTAQLKAANARLHNDLGRQVYIRAENFDTTFTEHESQQLDALIGFDEEHSTFTKIEK